MPLPLPLSLFVALLYTAFRREEAGTCSMWGWIKPVFYRDACARNLLAKKKEECDKSKEMWVGADGVRESIV